MRHTDVPDAQIFPPWRPEDGEEPEVTVFPPGAQPLLLVRVNGRWRIATVMARQDSVRGVVYQVCLWLGVTEGSVIRSYRWPQPGLRAWWRPPA